MISDRMRNRLFSMILVVLVSTSARSQDYREQLRERNISDSILVAGGEKQLPRFEIPEFVITGGSFSFIKPGTRDVEPYRISDEVRFPVKETLRDRASLEIEPYRLGFRKPIQKDYSFFTQGLLGNRAQADLQLRGAGNLTDLNISGSAQFRSTNGYQPQSRTSLFNLATEISSPVSFGFPLLENSVAFGNIGLNTRRYNFFGSANPDAKRSLLHLSIGGGLTGGKEEKRNRMALYLSTLEVRDSSALRSETFFSLASGMTISTFDMTFPVQAGVSVASEGRWLFHTEAHSPVIQDDGMSLTGGLVLYVGRGMSESLLRLYPTVQGNFSVHRDHEINAIWGHSVQFPTLYGEITKNPYLGSMATLNPIDIPMDLSLSLVSHWSGTFRTLSSVRYQYYRSLGLYSDEQKRGMWDLYHIGPSSVFSLEFQGVASIGRNDYFSLIGKIRTSETKSYGKPIPYLAPVSLSVFYQKQLVQQLWLQGAATYFSRSVVSKDGQETIPSRVLTGISAGYSVAQRIDILVSVENLLDLRSQEWMGYNIDPLTIRAGISWIF